MNNSENWFSYHIFFEDDRDVFLQKAIVPLIEVLKAKLGIQQFFYIRYNEGGPHIRIRILSTHKKQTTISKIIDATCRSYFGTNDFKLREMAYHPETERYGGTAALPFAEAHFVLSSKVCLTVLAEQPEDVLSRALLLHFCMIAVSNLSTVEIYRLYDSYVQSWFPHSGLSETDTNSRQVAFKHYEPEYQKMPQKALFGEINKRIEANEETGISWLDTWIKGNKNILSDLFRSVGYESRFHRILESLIHMTNNRLGVKNYDEAFLAYLLKRTIEDAFTPEPEPAKKP